MSKTTVVAELSANHKHNFDIAVKTIEAMAEAGADAVKFQTFRPDSFTLDAPTPDFGPRTSGLWKGYRPIELYSEGSMPYEWQPRLKEIANSLGMMCFSTPFDYEGVDFLESINVPIYKVASLEINDTNLIHYIASKKRPVVMSTGAASLQDIETAISICRGEGVDDITLLKCTSEYPAPIEKANLNTMVDMRRRFNVKVGVSDHSMSNTISMAAVALGATMVEKHFILDRSLGGIDSAFSLTPHEFKSLVESIREVEQIMGKVDYTLSETDQHRRRSLYVAEDMKAGEIITEKNIRSVRPGYGLAPKYLSEILGKKVCCDLAKGTRMSLDYVIKY